MKTIRPFFASETYGSGPFRNCRGSSIFYGVMLATGNEAALNAFGRHVGVSGRTAMLRQMWAAFEAQVPADNNGWADQGDVILMQKAIWPNLPLPRLVSTVDGEAAWDDIGTNAISLAIDTSVLPASDPIRRWVGEVTHQGVGWQKRVKDGVRQVKWVCPMHPRSNTFTGIWVEWTQLRKAARAVPLALAGQPGGQFIYEVYPIGKWTASRLAADRTSKATLQLVKRLRERDARQSAENADLAEQVAALTLRIDDAAAGNKKAAGWESALVRSIESLQALRTMGPPA